MHKLVIGVSMRETEASGYLEVRDSLARDWPIYLNKVFYDAKWLFVPNMNQGVEEYLEDWGVNALILTGGDDLGKYPERDVTEEKMFQYALENNFPILGVCRGMQAIYTWMGGKVNLSNDEFAKDHVAAKHEITMEGVTRKVNSYHRLKLDTHSCPDKLSPLAHCLKDQSMEAFQGDNILGLMWHPERESEPHQWEVKLIREFFKLDK